MNLNIDEMDLLKLLNNHKILTLNQISSFLKKSSVSSRSSLYNLNIFLKKYKIGEIKNNKKDGYELFLYNNLNVLKNLKPIENLEPEERQNYLICKLIFEDIITLTSIVEELKINRNTLNLDLNKIKKIFKLFNLKIISIPWKGIQLSGTSNDISSFSIQFLTKFFYEKDLNANIWNLYEVFVNPKMKLYFDEKLKYNDIDIIKKIIKNLLKKIDFFPGPYTYTALKSVFIYQYLKLDKNKVTLNLNSFDELTLKEYNKIYTYLKSDENVNKNDIFKKNIKYLSYLMTTCTEPFIASLYKDTLLNSIINLLLQYFKDVYDISKYEFENDELAILINLIRTFDFKYKFSVYNHRNYHITNAIIPCKIIEDIKAIFDKNNYNFLDEDYFLLATYIYQIVCSKYSKFNKNIKILIIGSSFNNWLEKGLKSRLNIYVPGLIIDEISIFTALMPKQSLDFNKYDFILFSNYIDKETFFQENKNLQTKISLLNYEDYFNVNFFWDLIFHK